MSTSAPSPLPGRLQVLAAAALFSSGGAVIKSVQLAGWQVACFRSAIAAVALLLLMPETRRRPSLRVLAVGVASAATMVLFVLANKLTTAASAIYLQSTSPLYVLLLSPWLLRERIRPRDVAFMVALIFGLGLFFMGFDAASETAPNPALGNALSLISGGTFALTIIGLRALGRGGESWAPTAALWGNVFTAAACLPMAMPVASSRPIDWLLLVYLGVCQIGIAYLVLIRGLQRVRAFEASLLLLLEPVLNPIWAWLVHGERPGVWSLAGGGVILLATLVKSWADARGGWAPDTVYEAPRD